MNWYKKAKLIDKKHVNDIHNITVKCMYCYRWATHPQEEKIDRDSYIWKKDEELDKQEYEIAKESLLTTNVSSAICPHCWKILKKHNNNINPHKVRELSLKE